MPDYVTYICPQFTQTQINFQRVPTVDTSNPFISRWIPTPDESMIVIRFANPRGIDARSDVYAQLLRARLYGEKLAGIPLDRVAAAREAKQAAGFQLKSADARVAGGFLFGRKSGEALPFVNPVSTAFCVQALIQWDDRKNNAFEARRHLLI